MEHSNHAPNPASPCTCGCAFGWAESCVGWARDRRRDVVCDPCEPWACPCDPWACPCDPWWAWLECVT